MDFSQPSIVKFGFMMDFKSFAKFDDHIKQASVLAVELPTQDLQESIKKIGQHTVRKDQPHFSGDEYHAHVELPGGKEVSYTVSGKRRHPNKFPANVPDAAKQAIATVLGISADLLETFWVGEASSESLLFEVRETTDLRADAE